jgi:hypothetical protein
VCKKEKETEGGESESEIRDSAKRAPKSRFELLQSGGEWEETATTYTSRILSWHNQARPTMTDERRGAILGTLT